MRSTTARTLLVIVIFLAALGGALVLLQHRDADDPTTGPASRDSAESTIWKVGDRWTVKVRQDAGAITPDGDASIVAVPYRFEVVKAPKGASDAWIVRVTQDGAQGPFADGWTLQYRPDGDGLELWRVAAGSEPALEAQLASIVLGPQFPYETRYDAPPKNATIDAAKLIKRTSLPPSALPASSGDSGAAPPAVAPRTGDGAAPVAPPTPVAPPA